jgi:hypothetical protein
MGLREIESTLPPGFRFYPSDQELVCHYLYKKVTNERASQGTLVEVDLHAREPWELPGEFTTSFLGSSPSFSLWSLVSIDSSCHVPFPPAVFPACSLDRCMLAAVPGKEFLLVASLRVSSLPPSDYEHDLPEYG